MCRQFSPSPQKEKPYFRVVTRTPEQIACGITKEYLRLIDLNGGTPIIDSFLQSVIADVALRLSNPDKRFGMMFYGGCGNGKTTLMKAIYEFLLSIDHNQFSEFKTRRWGFSCLFLSADEVCEMWKDRVQREYLIQLAILVIDDLGTEPLEVLDYGNVSTPIISLLERRYAERRFTAVTTNLNHTEIRPRYKDRIADRFNEMFRTYLFSGPSFRK